MKDGGTEVERKQGQTKETDKAGKEGSEKEKKEEKSLIMKGGEEAQNELKYQKARKKEKQRGLGKKK